MTGLQCHRGLARLIPWRTGLMVLVCGFSAPSFGQGDADSSRPLSTAGVPILLPTEEELHEVAIEPEVRELVRKLGSPLFETREEASDALQAMRPGIPQLCGLLGESDLSHEQRHRLLIVLKDRIITVPRAALGVSMARRAANVDRLGGIEVVDIVGGLPAEKILRIGDRITHINGRNLRSRNQLVVMVQSTEPGEEMRFTIRRTSHDAKGDLVLDEAGRIAFETLEVSVVLGSAERLLDPVTGQPPPEGAVERERQRQAEEAARRYAPEPRRLEIRGAAGIDSIIAPPSGEGSEGEG